MTHFPTRLRIGVLFGGRSSEDDVSVMSATNVVRALDPQKYEALPIFVTREGRWLVSKFTDGELNRPSTGIEICLVPGGRGRILAIGPDGKTADGGRIDILFPVLHGLHGEDGAVQGFSEVARVPLVGCSILGSAAALDKDITKQLLKAAGLPVARSVTIHQHAPPNFELIKEQLGLPLFIKPARQGSSVGVRKIWDSQEFAPALAEAFGHDRKLIGEEFIAGREIECSVLEDTKGGLFISRPGEIVPAESHDFYSYDAKYIDDKGVALKVPAELHWEVEEKIRATAARAFRALGCDGMARVDFFLKADMRFVVNEVNTMPGFTDVSMYPKAMAASGVSYAEIIDRLVDHGLARGA
ncbi:D-alanine--D-alanine ligase [Rhizobium leguminosarum bv. trifolii WSM2297]|uniref:D-alanine--D-alanine ligase n=1 Tax=Rhizobium leguminosarum bv. trifolii WSM2297 TaxID=754762 RepID=J0W6D2_RHILT|nr:D-alanine--D-alanine ligase family protein [Rhizobium leguminosarum]EJC80693.1 D-alanine--D-alanine ligase [Rhizobium leguminosarum bv. trifolii WSM2297]